LLSCQRLHSVVPLAFASETRGLPNRAPSRLALASPALTRSEPPMFSCLAIGRHNGYHVVFEHTRRGKVLLGERPPRAISVETLQVMECRLHAFA